MSGATPLLALYGSAADTDCFNFFSPVVTKFGRKATQLQEIAPLFFMHKNAQFKDTV
jgi:hypothetical protein